MVGYFLQLNTLCSTWATKHTKLYSKQCIEEMLTDENSDENFEVQLGCYPL